MLAPLLRVAPWRALLGLVAIGAGLGACGVLVGGGSGMRIVQLGLVVVGASAGCALDDAAAPVTAACPVPRRVQIAVRALAAAPGVLGGLLVAGAWWVAERGDKLMAVELGGTWVLAFALAAMARLRIDEPGEVVVSGLALLLLSVIMSDTIGRRLALFPLGEQGSRAARTWGLLCAAALVGLALAVRERRWARKDR
jgi:hypothetical protein